MNMKKVISSKRSWFPWLVIGLLSAHVAGMVLAVIIATGDHSFVALPDFYSKAVKWDQSQEAARKSDALNWKRTFTLSKPDARGNRTVSVRFTDAKQASLPGLKVTAIVYPELLQTKTIDLSFSEDADGNYSAVFTPTHAGPIVVELRASRNDETFLSKAELFVGSGS